MHKAKKIANSIAEDFRSASYRIISCQSFDRNRTDRRFAVSILGKIYNAKELAEYYEVIATTSDEQIIETLFRKQGVDLFKKLNGEFALIIWDNLENKLFLVTDRIASRDLFYYFDGRNFIFSKDIKSILKYEFVSNQINEAVLKEFMYFRYIAGNETLFKNIYKLMPGQYLEYNEQMGVKLKTYWNINFNKDYSLTERICLEEIDIRLKNAISSRISDTDNVGLTLSGGIDSSTVALRLNLKQDKHIYSYCVASKDILYDDNKFALEITNKINSRHTSLCLEDLDLKGDLEKIIWTLEEPTRFYNTLALNKLFTHVDKGIKIMLSGNGPCVLGTSEEIFLNKIMKLDFMPKFFKRGLGNLSPIKIFGKHIETLSCFYDFGAHNYIVLFFDIPSLQYNQDFQTFEQLFGTKIIPEKDFENTYKLYNSCHSNNLADRYYYMFRKVFLSNLAKRMAKIAYSKGIESREPFFDNKIVEFGLKIPHRIKIGKGYSKYLLKKLLQRDISKEFVFRKKLGFYAPLKHWLDDETKLGSYIKILEDKKTLNRGIFNKNSIMNLLLQHRSGTHDHSRIIWALISFEVWMRIFIDKSIRIEG